MKVPKTDALLGELIDAMTVGVQTNLAMAFSAEFLAAIISDRTAFDFTVNDHKARKEAVRVASRARSAVLKEAYAFASLLTQVLKPKVGPRTNGVWEMLAFPQGSLASPTNSAKLMARLSAASTFLEANPALEVPGLELTAIKAAALVAAINEANGTFNNALAQSRAARLKRAAARKKLEARARIVADTLANKLEANDPLWLAFGLLRPVDIRTPDVPAMPEVRQTGPATLEVRIPKATRARRYRVFIQGPEDAEPMAVLTVRDLIAVLDNLPTGKLLKVTVTAANASGESQASEAVEITLA